MPQSQNGVHLFNSVPKDYFGLFQGNDVDGQKVVEILNYKKKEVSAATGVNVASVRYDSKMPQELKERLFEWAIAINLVGSYFQSQQKTMIWFHTPNPLLGDLAPRDMIRLGRFQKLIKFIRTALDDSKKTGT